MPLEVSQMESKTFSVRGGYVSDVYVSLVSSYSPFYDGLYISSINVTSVASGITKHVMRCLQL
jgi:hypothetical protein